MGDDQAVYLTYIQFVLMKRNKFILEKSHGDYNRAVVKTTLHSVSIRRKLQMYHFQMSYLVDKSRSANKCPVNFGGMSL